MYYLLENNSIHYDGDKKKIQSATYDFGRKEMSINGGKWKKWVKHSENVFDLIEFRDLLKVKYVFKSNRLTQEYIYIREVFVKNEYTIEVEDNCNLEYTQILAIYKPNKKGDYIKVWERENEKS